MKQIIAFGVFISVFLFSSLCHGAKVATLTEVLKPVSIYADKNQLYIAEDAIVHIYSLKDYSYKTRFGKEGEGPREFKPGGFGGRGIFLDAQTDTLIISSLQKVSFFSKDGKYIKELKSTGGILGGQSFQPLGKKLVYQGFASKDKTIFTTTMLADDKLNTIKEVMRAKSAFQQGKKRNPLVRAMTVMTDLTCNRIVTFNQAAEIRIFDENGNEKLTFTPNIKTIPFDAAIKKKVIDHYKTHPRSRRTWKNFIQRLEFPVHLPRIRAAAAADSRIYVLTYYRKGDNSQLLIYDKNGKPIKKTYIPMAFRSFLRPHPFVFRNNKLYQLIENEDEEEWELHITPIN